MERILIVDKIEKSRSSLKEFLIKEGYYVIEADNCDDALKIIQTYLPEIVLIDISTSTLTDGVRICNNFIKNPLKVPTYVILITSQGDIETKKQAVYFGANDFMVKPFNAKEFLTKLRVGIRTILIERNTIIDKLTGLYNRTFFEPYLLQEIERTVRYLYPLTLALVDVDNFREVNQKYGYNAGDLALVEMGIILKKYTRNSDLLVRWGGDKFILLLPETGQEGGLIISERIRAAVEIYEFETIGNMTVSIGLARLTSNVKDLLHRVYLALEDAKSNGRNLVVCK